MVHPPFGHVADLTAIVGKSSSRKKLPYDGDVPVFAICAVIFRKTLALSVDPEFPAA
jgi:hypothetical protein